MTELIRDTVFGHLLRWVSGGKILSHPEDIDVGLWKKYVHHEKTARIASHGHTDEPEPTREWHQSDSSDDTKGEGQPRKNDLGMQVDPEKGKDLNVIHFEENDPGDPMNWSRFKKFFVTFEICLLTTSVYIGSAIYTAGTEGVMMDFGVSQVAVRFPVESSPTNTYTLRLRSG